MHSGAIKILAAIACLCAAFVAANGNANPASTSLSVTSWITSATVIQPEVHVLLRNPTTAGVRFTLRLGIDRSRCTDMFEDFPLGEMSRPGGAGVPSNTLGGIVPAGSWTHRVFLIGGLGVRGPCEVPLRIQSIRGDAAEDYVTNISIPGSPASNFARGLDGKVDVRLSGIVETEIKRIHGPVFAQPVASPDLERLLIRIMADNRESQPIEVRIVRRDLSCPSGDARWALKWAPQPGLDTGSFAVPPRGIAVFVHAVDLDPIALDAAANCTVAFTVEHFGPKHGWTVLGLFKMSLKPAGSYRDEGPS